ncbi:DUF1617 family protein [Sutcliffiella horikoshii]|uniref:DUF1617 family protein n=1 Tax=Sutcliffiella horikoshii TaxID=79883 RepID=UPI00203CF9F2|nr:DUF1617 family protein [Sutcliffiella horikoshii]MCM3619156.1 DUF1617 family protein [Sutcliffiella horikoshii]
MKLAIENGRLGQVIDLLFSLPLKGKKSRHRTRLQLALEARLKEVAEQEHQLRKEHCHLDKKGEPKLKDEGKRWDVKDIDAFIKDKTELYEEEMVIEGADNHGMLKTVKDVLDNCEMEWSGQEAVTYNYICEQLEGGEK